MKSIIKTSKRSISAILTLCMLLSVAGTCLNVTATAAETTATVEATRGVIEETTVVVEKNSVAAEESAVGTEENELVPMMAMRCGHTHDWEVDYITESTCGKCGGTVVVRHWYCSCGDTKTTEEHQCS